MNLLSTIAKHARRVARSRRVLEMRYPDIDAPTLDIYARVAPYTMTSPLRIAALCDAVRYVEANQIPGAFVECGVWKGGSSMAAALSFRSPRPLYLFDTFEGMTEPSEKDVRAVDGNSAHKLLASSSKQDEIWCVGGIDEVKFNMDSTAYPQEKIFYIKGRVEDTIPDSAPDQISVLRLDTDWYQSTRHELLHLYPRLSPGGVLILDDYGWWKGSRHAVDEYFNESVLLHRIDESGRMLVKYR
jgi:O-methyltransferase